MFKFLLVSVKVSTLIEDVLSIASNTLEHSTVQEYQKACKTHLIPAFGHLQIRDLSAQVIRKWVRNVDRKAKTVRNILIPLRSIVEQAVTDDLIEKNPFDRIILSKLLDKKNTKSDFEVDRFSQEKIKAILGVATGQIRNLFQFAFYSGLRTSELMGLE